MLSILPEKEYFRLSSIPALVEIGAAIREIDDARAPEGAERGPAKAPLINRPYDLVRSIS
jgi:hypothetical protein